MRFLSAVILLFVLVAPYTASAGDVRPDEQPQECLDAGNALASLLTESNEKAEIQKRLAQESTSGSLAKLRRGYCRAVLDNALSKQGSLKEGATFTSEELNRSALLFERFRIETYLSSGVSPKRYFGFFDGQGKTADYERRLITVGSRVAPFLNDFAASIKSDVRVSAKEIIVTFLAEGGSLLLTDEFENIDRAHPVRHVGLDDYRKGFSRYPGLIQKVDENFGTRLQSISMSAFGRSTLLRPMTFIEAVLSTGVMFFYEKELTEQKRLKDGRSSVMTLPLAEQFVQTSLVYNSGILFSDERVSQILNFGTGAYLVDANEKNANKRPQLVIRDISESIASLEQGGKIPRQLTYWNAVYHVSQRYGAWAALERFTNLFDDSGQFLTPERDSFRFSITSQIHPPAVDR